VRRERGSHPRLLLCSKGIECFINVPWFSFGDKGDAFPVFEASLTSVTLGLHSPLVEGSARQRKQLPH